MEQILLVLFYTFLGITFIQVIYYLFIFGKFTFAKPTKGIVQQLSVSVIVCAKNEQENIKKILPLLLEQNYNDYEIIVIDDASTDDTREILEDFENKYPKIKLVKVENNEAFWGNKKFALTLGIKSATKDYLLFTDADCYPNSLNWIAEMTAHFTPKKTFVLGYGAYQKQSGLLNKLIRLDTLLTAIQYFAWAKFGKPYMGVGRNLAYKKDEFYKVNGFIDHIKVRSGDDNLFVNQASNSTNTSICFTPDSFTYSEPKQNFKDWIMQKRRHRLTVKYYKNFDKYQLAIFYFSQLLFVLLPIVLFSFQYQWLLVLIAIAVRYISSWISIMFAAKKLQEKDLIYWYPIAEIVLIFIQIPVFVKNIFSKPITWK